MKEPYRKGVASHPDPESCVVSRKTGREAVTGAHAGWVSSCEIIATRVPVPTQFNCAEGNTGGCESASIRRTLRSLRPRHAWKLHAREPGDPINARHEVVRWPAGEGMSQKSSMHVVGESDSRELPTKCPNKGGKPLAEDMEGRRLTKENTEQTTASWTQSWVWQAPGLRELRLAESQQTLPVTGNRKPAS